MAFFSRLPSGPSAPQRLLHAGPFLFPDQPMKYVVAALVGVVAMGIGAWRMADLPPSATVAAEASNEVPSAANDPAADPVSKVAAQPAKAPVSTELRRPLTLAEQQRLGGWMKDRRYLFDLSNGGRSGAPSATGYDAMDDELLRALARSGDRTAALTLGLRLSESRPDPNAALPSSRALEEARAWLTEATVRGYTSSLDRLAELSRLQAMHARELRKGERFIEEHLLDAYAYGLLLERRGDVNAAIAMQLISQTGRLNDEQHRRAMARADALYGEYGDRRRAIGLPPFQDGLPEDVRQLALRMVQLHMAR